MRYYLAVLLIALAVQFNFAQEFTITGTLKNVKNNSPLPFANVVASATEGTITNRDGEFKISSNKPITTLKFSYIGFKTKSVTITKGQTYINVFLEESAENLGEIVVTDDAINPAIAIIKKAIENKKNNDPQQKLNSYKFNTYSKLLVTGNPDSISSGIDTISKMENGVKKIVFIDSTGYDLKKQLDRSHLFITEKISENLFTQEKGVRENVLATRIAGLKEPIYELLAIELQSFSFYQNQYKVFGTNYPSPIANNALKEYTYRILDTIAGEHPSYMIYYKPKEKGDVAGLQGVLYIDTESYALQKAVAQLKAVVDIDATQEFNYYKTENIWFPTQKTLSLKEGDTDEDINILNGAIKINTSSTSADSTLVHSSQNNNSKLLHMTLKEENSNILLNTPVDIKGRGYNLTFEDNAAQQPETFWQQYRTDSLTQRGRETYVVIDSMAKAENIEATVSFVRKLTQGFIKTKYIDLDLKYLIKYNQYEGFRTGIGFITNNNFSSKYRINGYTVYGFRDEEFKYGIGGMARLDKFTNTWLSAMYIDDLEESGSQTYITDARSFSVFQPRLFNIETFHRKKEAYVAISHNPTAKIDTKLKLTHKRVDPTYSYSYLLDGDGFISNYQTTSATIAAVWNPFSKYMLSPEGVKEYVVGYPKFTGQIEHSFKDVLGSNLSFTKLNGKITYQKNLNKLGTFTAIAEAGYYTGDLPIMELYNTLPNNPSKIGILKRFSVAGFYSFETMYFNEFFSDKYATLQLRHNFPRTKIIGKFRPQFSIFSRYALGTTTDRYRHINFPFNTLEKGYMESGFEMNKILLGFGLSAAYRYGAYHLPNFEDNVSFKFTYTFGLGI